MSFSSDIKKATEKYKKGYNKVVNESLFKLSRSVVFMTPVDEGRAQGNWFASLDGFNTNVYDETGPQFSQIENITDGAAGSVFYLINNLPYIGKLEFEGHSQQAPTGMVRVSLENFQLFLDESAKNL